jgi:hypothetical protein
VLLLSLLALCVQHLLFQYSPLVLHVFALLILVPFVLASPGQVQVLPPALVQRYEKVRAEVSVPNKDLCFAQLFLQRMTELMLLKFDACKLPSITLAASRVATFTLSSPSCPALRCCYHVRGCDRKERLWRNLETVKKAAACALTAHQDEIICKTLKGQGACESIAIDMQVDVNRYSKVSVSAICTACSAGSRTQDAIPKPYLGYSHLWRVQRSHHALICFPP